MLNFITHGAATDQPNLVIGHGLFGSGRNWGVIAKRLSDSRQVIAIDQRNHGQSPWADSHSYADMAADLIELLHKIKQDTGQTADVLGHSMGGKAAMVAAIQAPDLIRRLIVADIAPVAYAHDQSQHIAAMRAVDLTTVQKRSDAAAQLAAMGTDPALQSFFTQSLDVTARVWRFNLDVLKREMPKILSFPDVAGQFTGPTLFLAGKESNYVRPEDRSKISALFPRAWIVRLAGAGHWLHADAPRPFEAAVRQFLDAQID